MIIVVMGWDGGYGDGISQGGAIFVSPRSWVDDEKRERAGSLAFS